MVAYYASENEALLLLHLSLSRNSHVLNLRLSS